MDLHQTHKLIIEISQRAGVNDLDCIYMVKGGLRLLNFYLKKGMLSPFLIWRDVDMYNEKMSLSDLEVLAVCLSLT